MNRILAPIKDFYRSITRVIAWLPLIWKDQDWDYGFLERILVFKLRRMADCIESNNIIEANNRVAKQIRYAVYLFDRRHSDYDSDLYKKRFEETWGRVTYVCKPAGPRISRMRMIFEKATTPELAEKAEAEYTTMLMAVLNKEDELHRRMYSHISKYMRGWWD